MKRVRLLVVDNHAVVREGLRSLLRMDDRVEVVAHASDGVEALSAAERLLPDIVVTELALPGMSGAQLARRLKESVPHVRIFVLTSHEERGYVRSLIDAGASAYVLKRSPVAELLHGIEVVTEGGTYLDSAITEQLFRQSGRGPRALAPSAALSEREHDVVRLIAHGYSNKEIAAKLDLSVKTVETYRCRACEKLQLQTRADLVQYAIDQGWLSKP